MALRSAPNLTVRLGVGPEIFSLCPVNSPGSFMRDGRLTSTIQGYALSLQRKSHNHLDWRLDGPSEQLMKCQVSTYSFIERLIECGLYGFSLTQVLMLVALALVGTAYAIWEHRKQVREEKNERSDRM